MYLILALALISLGIVSFMFIVKSVISILAAVLCTISVLGVSAAAIVSIYRCLKDLDK